MKGESQPHLESHVCERARLSRDVRFDGSFYTAVKTTGIYCRPVCPAPAPKPQNVEYYPSAAAANTAGYRPCLRCRPELAPQNWQLLNCQGLLSAAFKLLQSGYLNEHSVADLADRLGLSQRHMRRLFKQELGASPNQVAQTQRLFFARQLLDQRQLTITQVAMASGFRSLRRFNEAFLKAFAFAPSHFRRKAGDEPQASASDCCTLRLPYRGRYPWRETLRFLQSRAVDGLEKVEDGAYSRLFVLQGVSGSVTMRDDASKSQILVELNSSSWQVLYALSNRVRRFLDLDTDVGLVKTQLENESEMAALVRRLPQQRLLTCWSPFEAIVRAVVGQLISVRAAQTILGRLLANIAGQSDTGAITCFPTPAQIMNSDISKSGLTANKAHALKSLASIWLNVAESGDEPDIDYIAAVKGVGQWTLDYYRLRGLGEPDAFVATDLAIRKALAAIADSDKQAKLIQSWRPWRGYANFYLWRSLEG